MKKRNNIFKEEKNCSISNILYLKDLKKKSYIKLFFVAESLNIKDFKSLNKHNLILEISKDYIYKGYHIIIEGILDILLPSNGFLRSPEFGYMPCIQDVFVPQKKIREFCLRNGDNILAYVNFIQRDYSRLVVTDIMKINCIDVHEINERLYFDELTPLYPRERICLEMYKEIDKNSISITGRIIDIISPLGKGQRALIVSPPKSGKTTLIQNIAYIITKKEPSIELIILLIGERPEEVTDIIRSVKCEVISSTFDDTSFKHVKISEIVIEKAKRLVENKKDVVILLDSITRLARAYNSVSPSSGRVLSGGIDSNALNKPKRFFGAARNTEEGGSLTIIATALVDTGSKMDEVIFEEFKGTGNSEIILDRSTAEKRIFPAINISRSGTRKEELLITKERLSKIFIIRKILNIMNSSESIEFLISKLRYSKNNNCFFDQLVK